MPSTETVFICTARGILLEFVIPTTCYASTNLGRKGCSRRPRFRHPPNRFLTHDENIKARVVPHAEVGLRNNYQVYVGGGLQPTLPQRI